MKKKYISIIIFLLIISIINDVNAKYILNRNFSINISTMPFYFEAETNKIETEMVNSEALLELFVKNNNGTEYNQYAVDYEISIQDNADLSFLVDDISPLDGIVSKNIIGEAKIDDTFAIKFTPNENVILGSTENVTLKLLSTSPYSKEINIPITIKRMPVTFTENANTGYLKTAIDTNIGTVSNQSIYGNVLTIDLDISSTNTAKKNIAIKFQATNNNGINMTNGTITSELEGDTSVFNKNPTINKLDKFEKDRAKDITITLQETILANLEDTATAKIKFSYKINEKIEEFYIVINLIRQKE